MSEVGKVKDGFSGIPEIDSKIKKFGEKRVSTPKGRVGVDNSKTMETSPLWRREAGYVVRDPLVYSPLTREETERVEHNDAMEREDRDRLMSLLQSKGLISKDRTYNGPGIFQYFTDKNGGVDRLIESINESDTAYTPDGKAKLYTADKDGITINFKVRGDYEVSSEEMEGTELIKVNPPLKLSWNDVIVWATEKPYSDRGLLPNGELPVENLIYLFFPEFENTSSLSGSKSKNIQSVLMNTCIINETRQYSTESAVFKYVKAQLEEKIAVFEKKGNEKAATGAKNALQYLDLVRAWASENEVSSGDSLDKELPENVFKVLDRIITDAGEAKVSNEELLQAQVQLKVVTSETIDKTNEFLKDIENGSGFNTKDIKASDFVGQLENIPNKNKITDIAKNDALNKAFKDIKDAAKAKVDGADYSKIGKGDINKNKNVDLLNDGMFGKFLKNIKDSGPADVKPSTSKLVNKPGINKRAAVNKNKIAGGAAAVGNIKKTLGIPKSLKDNLESSGRMAKSLLEYFEKVPEWNRKYGSEIDKNYVEESFNELALAVEETRQEIEKYNAENDPYVVNMMKRIDSDMQKVRSVRDKLLGA